MAQYIATRPILELYLAEERRPGARISWHWWEQDGIDLGIGEARPEEWSVESEREDCTERGVAKEGGVRQKKRWDETYKDE